VDNIKGKLKKHIPFEILKQGGITLNVQAVQVFEHDVLPEVDRYYVFLSYAQPVALLRERRLFFINTTSS